MKYNGNKNPQHGGNDTSPPQPKLPGLYIQVLSYLKVSHLAQVRVGKAPAWLVRYFVCINLLTTPQNLEEILASMGENGEREITWNFRRGRDKIHAIHSAELGTKDTLRIVWEMRIRELEEGWTTTFTEGCGLDNQASGSFCSNPNRLNKALDRSGNQFLGIKSHSL